MKLSTTKKLDFKSQINMTNRQIFLLFLLSDNFLNGNNKSAVDARLEITVEIYLKNKNTEKKEKFVEINKLPISYDFKTSQKLRSQTFVGSVSKLKLFFLSR
jgi:hypothetical protein